MAITVEAVYENGTLKLKAPLPFKEHEKVRVSVQAEPNSMTQAYGIIGWKGSAEELDQLLAQIEFEEDEIP